MSTSSKDPGREVQRILTESLGLASSKCYQNADQDTSSSCMSLPALMAPKPFRSKIPVPNPPELAPKPAFQSGGLIRRQGSSGQLQLRREMSLPPALLANQHVAKSCLDLKPPISPSRRPYSRSNSSISLSRSARRGSVDSSAPKAGLSKIPIWSASQEKINSNFAAQKRKWESCTNLEVGPSLTILSWTSCFRSKKWSDPKLCSMRRKTISIRALFAVVFHGRKFDISCFFFLNEKNLKKRC